MKKLNNPGTVSKILWHFTGGPTWNAKEKKQNSRPKKPHDAYQILCKIIREKTLRIGKYKEIVKGRIIDHVFFKAGSEIKSYEIINEMLLPEESLNVCCLADIPIQHLPFHSERYGRFAIGFHRDSAIHNNFNPVFYTLENGNIVSEYLSVFKHIFDFYPKLISFIDEAYKTSDEKHHAQLFKNESQLFLSP